MCMKQLYTKCFYLFLKRGLKKSFAKGYKKIKKGEKIVHKGTHTQKKEGKKSFTKGKLTQILIYMPYETFV